MPRKPDGTRWRTIFTALRSAVAGNGNLCAAEDTPKFYGAGFVTFTDQAKMKILSVSQQSLERYSAVSEKVAAEMATGAIERADADVSIASQLTAGA
ncbi:nicotinamide-nucleotide amidohydrolase family protein [Escherichia coli]